MTQRPTDTAGAGAVRVTATASVDADRTWRRIGGFADAGTFLDVKSALLSGNGGLGSERIIGDGVVEKMVAQGHRFYAYVQSQGPMASFGYHGCVAVEDDGRDRSLIVYTLVYDERTMSAEARTSERARLVNRFGGAVQAMARRANAD